MTVELQSSERPRVTTDTIIGWFCGEYSKHSLVHRSSRSYSKSTPASKVEAKLTVTLALKRKCSLGGVNTAAGALVETHVLPDGSTNQSVFAPAVILRLLSSPTFQSTGSFFHCRSPGRDGRVNVVIGILPLQGSIRQNKVMEDYNTSSWLKRHLSTNRPDDRSV